MAAKLSLTAAESALVDSIFKRNDPQKFGVLTGDVAVNVFSGSGLPSTALGEIWALADSDNKGFLDRQGVAASVRLIGHAQAGKPISEALLSQPGPPASISGYSQQPTAQGSRPPASTSNLPTGSGLPPLTSADKAKFLRLFQGCGPINGVLSGDKAREVFIKSKLPVDQLSKIWSLADTKSRGALDSTDFTIAMYIIQALMGGSLSFVPTTLPPGLYDQASPGDSNAIAVHATGGSFSTGAPSSASSAFASRAPVQPQYTGQSQSQLVQPQLTGSGPPRSQPSFFGSAAAPAVPQAWDVTPVEKANADKFFDSLDTTKRGFIEGDVAVPFMLQSKLPEDVLAHVWDLADMNNDGRLTRDGFAVAMHLIQGKLAGKDVPAVLPQSLVPPSMRSSQAQPQQPLAPVHELSDLLFDDEPAKPTQPPLQPQSTGPFGQSKPLTAQGTGSLAPQGTGGFQGGILQPQSTGSMLQPQTTGGFGSTRSPPPLQPQSTGGFGARTTPLQPQGTGALQPQGTGALYAQGTGNLQPQGTGPFGAQPASNFSSPFVTRQAPSHDPFGAPSAGRNLLDDDDEPSAASPPPGQDRSIEIGNTQNQLNSTNRSLDITKNERQDVEARLAEQAAQLSALQTQLTAAKASYETETRLLGQLRERFSNQTAEIASVRQELIRAESDLSAARVEKAEVEQGVLRDKEEIRGLQRQMTETGTAVETTKAEIERVKKEAKQQKGLLAIAKKQLAAREAERAKVDKELEEARADAASATREREEAEVDITKFDIASPAPVLAIGNGHPERVASPSTDSVSFAAAHPLPPGTPSSMGSPAAQKSNNPFDRFITSQPTGGSVRSASPFMPFANTSLPGSPPPAEAASLGFEQAFEQPQELMMNGESTPAAQDAVTSPTSEEEFSTPPTRPADTSSRLGTAELEAVAAHFPPLDSPVPAAAAETETSPRKPETDLGANLMELDADDSDSSSDDEDNRPLSQVAAAKRADAPTTDGGASTQAPAISFEDAFGGGVASEGVSPFDPPTEAHADAGANKNASPFDHAFAPPGIEPTAPPSSSKSAFDQSFGDSAGLAPASAPGISFDDAFEDNFDFGAASVAAPAPALAADAGANANPNVNGSASASSGTGFFPPPPNGSVRHSMLPPQAADKPLGSTFNPAPAPAAQLAPQRSDSNPFGAPSAWAPTPAASTLAPAATPPATTLAPTPPAPTLAPPPAARAQSGPDEHGISFDEAFGGVNTSQALALGDGYGSVSSRASMAPTQSPSGITETARTPRSAGLMSSPTTDMPSSPTRTERRVSISSPPRESTPPPARVSSPKPPRPSTASSSSDKHDRHERPKEPRRGISIRLPFGKKKKTHDAMPPAASQSHLQPVVDEEPAPVPPTSAGQDDDIEAVKQLCGMGFSRTQAVTALEANAYDLQRALNSLVGTV